MADGDMERGILLDERAVFELMQRARCECSADTRDEPDGFGRGHSGSDTVSVRVSREEGQEFVEFDEQDEPSTYNASRVVNCKPSAAWMTASSPPTISGTT